MRIGLITFHFAYNYGAVLQAWAMQTFLKRLGHEVEIIDYRPNYHTERYKVFRSLSVSAKVTSSKTNCNLFYITKAVVGTALENMTQLRIRLKKKQLFEQFFSNHFTLSNKQYKTIEDLRMYASNYDAMIAGSDQIWNSKLTNNTFDPAYFLDFVPNRPKKILYGVSFGETPVKDGVNYIKENGLLFDYYSCREKEDSMTLSYMLQEPCSLVPDPTFLLAASDYSTIESTPAEQKYCLVYLLKHNEKLEKGIEQLSKKGLYIVNISPFKISIKGVRNLYPLSPSAFVGYIKNADMVVTNSFHGIAFSIIYHKKFVCGLHGNRNARIQSLLNETGLESRLVTHATDFDKLQAVDINYQKAENKFNKLSERGKNYLSIALR